MEWFILIFNTLTPTLHLIIYIVVSKSGVKIIIKRKNCPILSKEMGQFLGHHFRDIYTGHYDFRSLSTLDLLIPVIAAISLIDFPAAFRDLTLAICITFSCAFGFFKWSASSPYPCSTN